MVIRCIWTYGVGRRFWGLRDKSGQGDMVGDGQGGWRALQTWGWYPPRMLGAAVGTKAQPLQAGTGGDNAGGTKLGRPKVLQPPEHPRRPELINRGSRKQHPWQAGGCAVRGDESPKALPAGFSCPSRFPRPPVAATWIPPGKEKQAKMLSFVCTTARLSGSIHLGLPSVPNFLPVPVVRGKPFFFLIIFFNYIFLIEK